MSENKFDFIIVGLGLAGSVLSRMLIDSGFKVLVFDKFNPGSSSQVAAGLVNPVTGRRVVKSWMADTLLPFANDFYRKIETESGKQFYHSMDVLEVVHSIKDLNEWTVRSADESMKKYFMREAPEELYNDKISEFKKLICINSSAWMNIPEFIELCRLKLTETSSIIEEEFDFSLMKINNNEIEYRSLKSKKIIFCDGYQTLKNELWKNLPFVPAKGEILTIKCPDLPEEFILLSGIFLIPVGQNKFRTGSTYEWNFQNELPSENGKSKLLNQVSDLLKVPFEIIDHRAGIRPTVKDRRPLIGQHPEHKNVFLFNGMGTKGVQLVPYFADHFTKVLSGKENLMDEVNLNRFTN